MCAPLIPTNAGPGKRCGLRGIVALAHGGPIAWGPLLRGIVRNVGALLVGGGCRATTLFHRTPGSFLGEPAAVELLANRSCPPVGQDTEGGGVSALGAACLSTVLALRAPPSPPGSVESPRATKHAP